MNELTSVFDTTGNFWIGNIPWQQAIHDVLAGKAFVVAEHDMNILTVRPEFCIKKPKWVVKLHANAARRLVRGHPPTLRNVFEEYGGICAYCTRETFIPTNKTRKMLLRKGMSATRDHIWPKCRGG